MNKRSFFTSVLALGFAATAVAGCSSAEPSSDAKTAGSSSEATGSSTQALGPIIKDPTTLDGATVTLPSERLLTFNVPEGSDVTEWTAKIEDSKVAEFTPGKADGSSVINPGISPLATTEGTTVTLTDPDGKDVTFTLIITEGAR